MTTKADFTEVTILTEDMVDTLWDCCILVNYTKIGTEFELRDDVIDANIRLADLQCLAKHFTIVVERDRIRFLDKG